MEPDVTIDGSTSPMTIISGTSAAILLSNNFCEHTGIGFGNFTTSFASERLWFSQWQNNSGNFYSVADNIGDYTKAGIINTVIY
jgi:hypothetical protein